METLSWCKGFLILRFVNNENVYVYCTQYGGCFQSRWINLFTTRSLRGHAPMIIYFLID